MHSMTYIKTKLLGCDPYVNVNKVTIQVLLVSNLVALI